MEQEDESLSLNGPLTIKTIGDARDILLAIVGDAPSTGRTLVIDLDEVSDCDLTLPQLLVSLQKTAKEKGVALRLKSPASGVLLTILERAGLVGGSETQDSFWLEGKAA